MKKHNCTFLVVTVFLFLTACSMQKPAVDLGTLPENSDEEADELLLTMFPERTGTPGAALTEAAAAQLQLEREAYITEAAKRDREKAKLTEAAEKDRTARLTEAAEKEAREKEEREKAEQEKAEQEQREKEEREKAEKEAAGIVEGPLGILMGSFTTGFSGSSSGRVHNIQHAAAMINGTKLAAGEAFSTSAAISPITEDNGYRTAGAYQDGKVIDSVGGGVCQISSTLYNAVIASELEVTERAEHSMTVSYVDVSRDAAIAGDYKDFCFVNNTDSTIYIEGWATDSEVTFQIWGADTKKKNGRTIEFETVILEEYSPGEPVLSADDSQPVSYYYETQSAHTGYKAELYKVIYQDGAEVDRIRLNTSVYEASPAYAVVGTQ